MRGHASLDEGEMTVNDPLKGTHYEDIAIILVVVVRLVVRLVFKL